MGDGGAFDRAVERVAVRLVVLVVAVAVGGCSIVPDVVGVVAAASSGSATGNPAVGIAVGIGVRAGVDELRKYVVRRRQAGEQDAIAEAAGSAPLGQARRWEIRHTIPLGNEHGELEAVREYRTKLATCRDIVFSVVDETRELFATSLCQRAEGWRWAAAEPAVDRWGFLQH
ncbi:MAG: lipoprotein [Acetobacteraceae bacterium]